MPQASKPVLLSNTAGVHVPFTIKLTRSDGEQDLSALTVSTPPGLLATLAGIPYCSDPRSRRRRESSYSGLEEEANPSCPAASQIGVSSTGAGAGTHPVYLAGKVYLAGPYKGAPLSLAVITPAVSGPYDLGNVVVRAALEVNPETAQITAVSDPLPQILEGIPLRLRQIQIELNRPNFTLNPTDCDPFSIHATASGCEGAEADLSYPFQVAECGASPLRPQARPQGFRRYQAHRYPRPALPTLTTHPGEANVARTSVTLPHSEFLDNAHIKDPLHPRPVCRRLDSRRTLSAGIGHRLGPCRNSVAWKASRRPRLSPLGSRKQERASRHRRRPERPDRHRLW